mgnify:CR=1 FL=1
MKDSVLDKGGQPDTHNNYLRHIRAIYNKALKDNTTYREFSFDKDLFLKVDKHSKKLRTNKPQDIVLAIERIRIKTHKESPNKKSAIVYAIRDLEAIGFWLLKFTLRGMYGKDIVSLSSKQYDYNDITFNIIQHFVNSTSNSFISLCTANWKSNDHHHNTG